MRFRSYYQAFKNAYQSFSYSHKTYYDLSNRFKMSSVFDLQNTFNWTSDKAKYLPFSSAMVTSAYGFLSYNYKYQRTAYAEEKPEQNSNHILTSIVVNDMRDTSEQLKSESSVINLPDPEVERQKTLDQIRTGYRQGIEYYNAGELKAAEQELVKVLRPTLSKPVMRALYVETEEVKAELLDAMYHLGMIYLQDDTYPNHHAKAAAIFQYCAGFEVKYELGDGKEFIRQAYLAEKEFLQSIGKANSEATEQSCFDNYVQNISSYQAELKQIRATIKGRLDVIRDWEIERITERTEETKQIYQQSSEFFVNHSKDAEGQYVKSGLIQKLLKDCYQQLGTKPEGLEFTVVGLGSLASGTMTPWSDLEFAIFINEDKEEYKEYCRNLTKLFHIKIINLGETHLRSLGIESLNNFKTANDADEWFWDEIMDPKLRFDSARWNASKHPLGRQGYKAAIKEKDENGVERTTIVDKPDYELILPPKQMAEFQKHVEAGASEETGDWFESDKHLAQSLRNVSLIDGSQELLDQYRGKSLPAAIDQEIVQQRALAILQEDVEKFSLKLGDEEEGKLFNVKENIYRLGDRIVVALADYYDIKAQAGEQQLTVWQMIERMKEANILSDEGAKHLLEAIAIATELRMNVYLHNIGQKEGMSTYEPAVEHLSAEKKQELLNQTFYIKDTSILHHFYLVMIPLQTVVKFLCDPLYSKQVALNLQNNLLYADDPYHLGMIHARFLQYDNALTLLARANTMQYQTYGVGDRRVLVDLLALKLKTYNLDGIIKIGGQILQILLEQQYNDKDSFHTDQLTVCNHLGVIMLAHGAYNDAIVWYQHELSMLSSYNSDCNSNNLSVANIYNNLGLAYSKKGEHSKSIVYYEKSLDLKLRFYKDDFHSTIASSYNNLGIAYFQKEIYDKSAIYLKAALSIYKNVYKDKPNHPEIAGVYINLSNVLAKQGRYEEAKKYLNVALEINLKTFQNIPYHPELAGVYINLGNIYDNMGMHSKAMSYFVKALEINEKVYINVSSNPEMVAVYNGLGIIFRKKNNYDKAIEYHKKSLDCLSKMNITKQVLMEMAISYNNLARDYLGKRNTALAEKYYNEALKIRLELCDDNSHSLVLAASYDGLGNVFKQKSKYGKAIAYFQQALAIKEKNYANNSNHSDIASSLSNLGDLYSAKKDHDKAIEYYRKALTMWEKTYTSDPNHFYVITNLSSLSLSHFFKEEYNQALIYSNKALEIYSKTQTLMDAENIQTLNHAIMLQLGNEALLVNDLETARKYYEQIDPALAEIDFTSKKFVKLQLEYSDLVYGIVALPAIIACQLVLIKIDPEFKYGNHYHNLACFYACQSNVSEANKAFLKALDHPKVNDGQCVEYAQFLIMNKGALDVDSSIISEQLYKAIKSTNLGGLSYGKVEQDSICNILKDLVKQKNGAIKIIPKTLAYYILVTNPEYIKESDNINTLLEQFCSHCTKLQNPIAFKLLADSYKSVGNNQLAKLHSEYAEFIDNIDLVLAGKAGTSDSLDQAQVSAFTTKLQVTAALAVTEGRMNDAVRSYQKLVDIFSKILDNQLESLQFAINNLATILLLNDDIEQYKDLKFERGAELDHDLIKLAGQEISVVLAQEQQIITQVVMQQQEVSSRKTPSLAEDHLSTQLADATPLAGDVLAAEQDEI